MTKRIILSRIGEILAARVIDESLADRLHGVRDAFCFMDGSKSYLGTWIEQAEADIRDHHKKFGPHTWRPPKTSRLKPVITEEPGEHPPCDCPVCRRNT